MVIIAPLKNNEEEVYISPEMAKKEIGRRRKSVTFHKTMEVIKSELWHGILPPIFRFEDPNHAIPAYLWRHIASARFEDIEFHRLTKECGLTPRWLEYTGDKFSTRNHAKIDLCQMQLYMGQGKNGGPKLDKYNLVNISSNENNIFRKIFTCQGESLVDFHHKIRKSVFPQNGTSNVFDISNWIKIQGEKSENSYSAFLALFILNGILYDDFHAPFSPKKEEIRQLDNFRDKVFLPAWRKVIEITGEQPLIVRLPSTPNLSWYPNIIKEHTNFDPLA